MSTMTLEPCPFCGCDDHETSPWRAGRRHESWVCNCGNPQCGARVDAPTPEEAVARWNRRAHLAQPAQAVDAGAIRALVQAWRTRIPANAGDSARVLMRESCADQLEAALTRALSGEKAGPADGWQPIDTAPRKIEFRCLLGHEHSVVTGYWDGAGWVNERSKLPHGRNYFPASVWRPLPASPAPDKEG